MDRLLVACLAALLALALTGCGTINYERARFEGSTVANPTLGDGVRYRLPPGYAYLNPYSPLPTKPQNASFERYVRGLAARNDKQNDQDAFRECLLFRSDDRYLVILHASLNLPGTFRTMHPGQRTLLMPVLAARTYRYFDAPQRDFAYSFEQIKGRNIIVYPPFSPDAAGPAGEGWRGTGCSLLGDRTDVIAIFAFARAEESAASQADIRAILDDFNYGLAAR